MIKVLTDQSASDSEPAIILTESNEHSEPLLSPKHERRCHPLAVGKPQGEKERGERGSKPRVRKRGEERRSLGGEERERGGGGKQGGRNKEGRQKKKKRQKGKEGQKK